MAKKIEEITIDGIVYVPKTDNSTAPSLEGLEYKIVRTYSAGVFAGYVVSRNGQEVKMTKARRLWYWEGAASLSQLAIDGVNAPDKCKFSGEVNVELMQAIEILEVSDKAFKSINNVKVWTA